MKELKKQNVMGRLAKNAAMLYIMTAAKLIFPLLTLPYLTRVLTLEGYAAVSYVKSFTQYMQLFVDFGFILSATKAIIEVKDDADKMSSIVCNTILSRLILAGLGFVLLASCIRIIPLLRENVLYTVLSYFVVVLSCFLTDYLFRGIEQMQEISIRFVVMKGISTLLTFFFVHSDQDLLMIPLLDILSSLAAIVLVMGQMKKYRIHYVRPSLRIAWRQIRESFEYFVSNIASTAFGALNTMVIGIALTDSQVALWSVAMQIISAIQVMYNPITDGIYPEMVKSKRAAILKRMLLIFMPLIIVGCGLVYVLSDLALWILGGSKYMVATPILRALIPVLLFSFPGMLIGWPGLGAIGRVRETTATTIFSAVIQVAGLLMLLACGQFTLMGIAVLRSLSEFCLFFSRLVLCVRYRKEFS